MNNLINELKIVINKELFQKEIISFSEFKLMNEELLKEKKWIF